MFTNLIYNASEQADSFAIIFYVAPSYRSVTPKELLPKG
jgi:hypothetical protein